MYEIDRKKFGEFISLLRKEKGIKQKELAERLYVSDKAVSKWETGHSIPDVSLLVPLAEILSVTVTELLEAERMEEKQQMDARHTDELMKKVIELSEEGQSSKGKKNVCIFLPAMLVSVAEIIGIYALTKSMDIYPVTAIVFALISIIFGAYAWIFIKEKLPAYYDENRIGVYVDGMLHMNIPGVYYNNNNWKYIVRSLRVWSLFGMVVFPVISVLAEFLLGELWMPTGMLFVLMLFLTSLFLPIVVAARKYENVKAQNSKIQMPMWKIVILILVTAAVCAMLLFVGELGCGKVSSGVKMMYVSNEGRDYWEAGYQSLNGFEERNFWLENGKDTLYMTFETQEGSVSVRVTDEKGEVIYEKQNPENGSYEVQGKGKIRVRIEGEKHSGSFEFRTQ